MSELGRMVLYGAGVRGMLLCKANWESGSSIEIAAVTDSNPRLWGTQCFGHIIVPPEIALLDTSIPVCIDVSSSSAIASIRDSLHQKYQIPAENLVDYTTLLIQIWETGQTADLFRKNYLKRVNGPISLIFDCNMGLGLGGIAAWSNALCSELIDRGWKNLHVYINSERPDEREMPAVLKEWEKLGPYLDWVGNSSHLPGKPEPDTLRYLAEKIPCIIVANSDETLCVACVLKKLYPDKVQVVSVLHGGLETLYQSRAKVKDYVDLFVTVSTDGLRAMAKQGCKEEQLRCMKIPFVCDEYLERTYSEYGSSPIKIGYAGRLEKTQKRMDLLLELIQSLLQKRLDFQLEIAGTGTYEDIMHDFVKKHHLEGKVSLRGQMLRENIPNFWRSQDICVNLADFEGRSISITEAMGNGAVPVVTDVSGVRDDIIDGENGYIVPVGDYQAMADRIALLAQDRERLKIMGGAAHDAVYPKSLMEPHIQFWEGILTHMAADLEIGAH